MRIDVSCGLYHCTIDEEDYHRCCLNNDSDTIQQFINLKTGSLQITLIKNETDPDGTFGQLQVLIEMLILFEQTLEFVEQCELLMNATE